MADSANNARRLRMGMAVVVPTLAVVMSVPIAVAAPARSAGAAGDSGDPCGTGPGGRRGVTGSGPTRAVTDSARASERGLRPGSAGRPVRSSRPSGEPALAGGSDEPVDGLPGEPRRPAPARGRRGAPTLCADNGFADQLQRGPVVTAQPRSWAPAADDPLAAGVTGGHDPATSPAQPLARPVRKAFLTDQPVHHPRHRR